MKTILVVAALLCGGVSSAAEATTDIQLINDGPGIVHTWGTVGNQLCHVVNIGQVYRFACPKNLIVKTFTCRGASKDVIASTTPDTFVSPNVSAFTMTADPANARITFNNTMISTTDVYMDDVNSADWTTMQVTIPWGGHYEIRDDPVDLFHGGAGDDWELWVPTGDSHHHTNLYTCTPHLYQ